MPVFANAGKEATGPGGVMRAGMALLRQATGKVRDGRSRRGPGAANPRR